MHSTSIRHTQHETQTAAAPVYKNNWVTKICMGHPSIEKLTPPNPPPAVKFILLLVLLRIVVNCRGRYSQHSGIQRTIPE
jgi:hypothetical protein